MLLLSHAPCVCGVCMPAPISGLRRRGAALGGAVLRKSLGFSHRRTSDHLQPPSVHGVRVHHVRFVKLVARATKRSRCDQKTRTASRGT